MSQYITDKLMELKDDGYKEFHGGLIPGVDSDTILGVRVPVLRKFAKELKKNKADVVDAFLGELPHKYYDEYLLHGMLISEMKDYDMCLEALERFLPYINNWAVCDTLSPKVFSKHKASLMNKIKEWSKSKETYTCRFGIEMLMRYFLDEDFDEAYLKIPASVKSEEYYVNMMIAWFFATALAKQWDSTIPLLESGKLGKWVHNKTIQKARESYRITEKQKQYLKTLKR